MNTTVNMTELAAAVQANLAKTPMDLAIELIGDRLPEADAISLAWSTVGRDALLARLG